jgi:histidine ammonia-lyase
MQQVLLSAAQHIMAQPKAYLIGGIGATPTLEDVSKIAEDSMQVALDPAGAERVKKLSPAPKSFQAADAPAIGADNSDQQPLATHLARAVLATKLLQLMNGRSGVRVLIPEFLTQLLNSPQLPLVLRAGAHDADVLKQIAAACYGQGVQAEGYEPPKLSSAEQLILQGGAAVTAGIAAVVVQASKKLLSLAAAGAALSLEALGAQVGLCTGQTAASPTPVVSWCNGMPTLQVKNLDADLMEAQGHKAAMAVADEMRGLLEGSKRVGIMKAAESDSLPPAFSAAAQVCTHQGQSGFWERVRVTVAAVFSIL